MTDAIASKIIKGFSLLGAAAAVVVLVSITTSRPKEVESAPFEGETTKGFLTVYEDDGSTDSLKVMWKVGALNDEDLAWMSGSLDGDDRESTTLELFEEFGESLRTLLNDLLTTEAKTALITLEDDDPTSFGNLVFIERPGPYLDLTLQMTTPTLTLEGSHGVELTVKDTSPPWEDFGTGWNMNSADEVRVNGRFFDMKEGDGGWYVFTRKETEP